MSAQQWFQKETGADYNLRFNLTALASNVSLAAANQLNFVERISEERGEYGKALAEEATP